MQVTATTKTAEGQLFSLDNGAGLLMKEIVTIGGKPGAYPVYVYASGVRYSARTSRFSRKTLIPAMVAVSRFQAAG